MTVGDAPIASTSNPLVKRIRALARRKERETHGEFFVDGIQAVWEALDRAAPVKTLVVARELLTSPDATSRVERAERDGVPVSAVTPDVYRSLSERENPSGLGAIVATTSTHLDDIPVRPDSVVVALEDIGNPGNLGTIVRTVDGAGASAVVVVGDATDVHHPAAVKASMGTLFSVPVCRVRGIDELFRWARSKDLSIVTTSARAPVEYSEASYRLPAVLLLGSEGEGLAPETLARGDLQVRIEMRGSVSSLNVAVAAGILLFEMRKVTSRPAPA